MFLYRKIVNICIVLISLVQYLSAKTCGNFEVKVTQALLEQGFHRNLTYNIVFEFENDGCTVKNDCFIGLDQMLPSGTYVSNDELNELKRNNKVNAVIKNRINIELPAEQSYPFTVYLISKVTGNNVVMWLPVHARYHEAAPGGGMSRIEIEPPKLYLTCPDVKPKDSSVDKTLSGVQFICNGSSKEKCSWKAIHFTMLTDILVWHVPVGNLNHYYTVSLTTGAVITIASLYVCKALHESSKLNFK